LSIPPRAAIMSAMRGGASEPDDDALPPSLRSLLAAVEERPEDVALRALLAGMLLEHGLPSQAIAQCSAVLERDSRNAEALATLAKATAMLAGDARDAGDAPSAAAPPEPEPVDPEFDWEAAESELEGIVEPAFVGEPAGDVGEPAGETDDGVERLDIRLADVGGMEDVKRRLETAFLTPMRNPELRQMYGRSLPGGMLLYGPPGCGKTYLARAIAGELGAGFHAVELADVLDMWMGSSERNLHEAFEKARRNAPCVLFLDEIDALGQKRSQLRGHAAMRGAVNQLLTEMDSVKSDNDGVFVLGATNHPWDVDTALIRPGRFDRMLLVVPPDREAREAILRHHLRNRPLEGIDVGKLARRTEHFSGADLAHLCDSAAELALEDSVRSGQARPIGMRDFERAQKDVHPSTGAWLEDARNVVLFANPGGRFDDLLEYLKKRKLA
jgi:SpoVK/Ycf46/Vps4 family AAA+-type ATPase